MYSHRPALALLALYTLASIMPALEAQQQNPWYTAPQQQQNSWYTAPQQQQNSWYKAPQKQQLRRKPVYKKPYWQQYQPPAPPPLPTYDPSQENPDIPDPNAANNQGMQTPYPPPAPSPPVNTNSGEDSYWSAWTNLGAAFMFNPDVSTYGQNDIVVAVNSKGSVKAKILVGTSPAWQPTSPLPTTVGVSSNPAVAVVNNNLDIYVVMTDSQLYYTTVGLSSTTITPGAAFAPVAAATVGAGTATILFQSNPTAVFYQTQSVAFAISTSGLMYYATGTTATVALSTTSELFIMDPAADVYTGTTGQHLVVAAVGPKGDLYIYDTNSNLPTAGATFWTPDSDVSCLDSPVTVSLGDRVEIYCRARDGNFYCVTVMNGDAVDSRILSNADAPRAFQATATYSKNINIYSRTPSGKVVTKIFKQETLQ
jgi:hypothetical protein